MATAYIKSDAEICSTVNEYPNGETILKYKMANAFIIHHQRLTFDLIMSLSGKAASMENVMYRITELALRHSMLL